MTIVDETYDRIIQHENEHPNVDEDEIVLYAIDLSLDNECGESNEDEEASCEV